MRVNEESYEQLLLGLSYIPLDSTTSYWTPDQVQLLAEWYLEEHEDMELGEALDRSCREWTSYESPSDAAFDCDITFNDLQEETTVLECNDGTVLVLEF